MKEEIICAGFGGQGIMMLGKVLAQAALKEKKHLSWMPSYGAAMRGGCAYCMVIISDQIISSPYIDQCDTLFVFNQPSWNRFKSKVRTAGLALLNSSLINTQGSRSKIKIRQLPFSQIASDLGDLRAANMVALGVFLREKNILCRSTILEVLPKISSKGKRHLLEINKKAIEKGWQIV